MFHGLFARFFIVPLSEYTAFIDSLNKLKDILVVCVLVIAVGLYIPFCVIILLTFVGLMPSKGNAGCYKIFCLLL